MYFKLIRIIALSFQAHFKTLEFQNKQIKRTIIKTTFTINKNLNSILKINEIKKTQFFKN